MKKAPLLLLLAAVAAPSIAGQGAAVDSASGAGTVLVELFTSQGCSSCPPADRLLRKLANDPAYEGRVIALAFHVDYWNYIGWRDPFSSASWSERQRRYAARFAAGTVYTPQLVVDGVKDVVGSQEADVRRRIAAGLARPDRAEIDLDLEPLPGAVRIRTRARHLLQEGSRGVVAYVALYEDGLRTPVRRGENAGRRLENDRVVRTLVAALELPAGGGEGLGEVEITLEPEWDRQRLGVAAFVQDSSSLAIHAATARTLAFAGSQAHAAGTHPGRALQAEPVRIPRQP